jgi:hypothetical protein
MGGCGSADPRLGRPQRQDNDGHWKGWRRHVRRQHKMAGDEAGCTRACVKQGPDYALVVKDKVYTLKASSDATKDQLDKLAGQTAKITGDLNGETIAVTSVQAAK